MGQTHFTRGESKGPSRGRLWPKPDNIKHKVALRYSRGQFSPRQNPKSHRTEGQKRYRTKLEKKSKISRESCPYCHSILCTWQSRILQLLQPPPTTFEYGLMGQVSVLESLNLHVDEGQSTQAGIKGKVSNL